MKAGMIAGHLDLCELENSNLRRHLLWAAEFLTPDQRKILSDKLREPIESGGVTEDDNEDREAYAEARDKAIEALVDHIAVAEVMEGWGDFEPWFARADALATALRAYLRPSQAASLHALRNYR